MSQKLIVDTNLLLLLIVGSLNEGRLISSSKRLNNFTKKDFLLLIEYMSAFKQILITPYILTELSNLIDLKGNNYFQAYKLARNIFSNFKEIKTSIKDDLKLPSFITHGITDASIINLVKHHVVLTNDNRMLPLLYEANENNVMPFEMLRIK